MPNSRLIAKNTLFLYIRMLFTMAVSLYTSRVVLNTLGIDDFGIYNLVGGIVILFSFINGAMTSATQRFLNFEMANNSNGAVRRVFSVSMNAHAIIMGIIVLLAETLGLWFLNYKLNIPQGRLHAANIVFQFSVFAFAVNILAVPYHASIVAYEKMSFYAWISIVEVLFKLLIVYLLVLFSYDKLVLYAILTFAVSAVIYLAYRFFCRRMFITCHYQFILDKKIFKELLSFSGWSIFGNMALIGSNQGIAMIMNIFLGVTINAAMGIANQINAAIFGFVSNFQIAFSPQITKTYASGDLQAHQKLIFQASKFSYFLLLVLAVPILLNTRYILTLWLKIVPDYAIGFTQLIIVYSLIDALAGPLWMSANATGKIKYYQIFISLIIMLNLPLAYLILYYGFSPLYVFAVKITINLLTYFFRVGFVYKHIKFPFKLLFSNLYLKILLVSVPTLLITYSIKACFFSAPGSVINFLVFSGICIIVTVIMVFTTGLMKNERGLVYSFVKKSVFEL